MPAGIGLDLTGSMPETDSRRVKMSKLAGVGFQRPSPEAPGPRLRPVALVQLIATVTLALSTLIAATAVSIGIARADIACPVAATTSLK